MISRFVNLFKKSDFDEQRAFQRRVLVIVRELQPTNDYLISEDPLALNLDGQVLGLTNIRANFLLSSQTDADLHEMVKEHFRNILVGLDIVERTELTWEQAKPNVMPQLMSESFLENLELVSFPFGGGIVIGFVVDSEKTYSYVSRNDIERWTVNELEIYDVALKNLNARSLGLEAVAVPGPNGLFVVNTLDGFDAVRVISADLRNYCAQVIGSKFYIGVPNRDFLICWSKSGDREFQDRIRAQVAHDFDERPYPLSPLVFEVDEIGEFRIIASEQSDPRAAAADNN